MNLALIDPFQLAQDYPDALTNDLRTYKISAQRPLRLLIPVLRQRPCHYYTLQPQGGLSRVR